MKLFCVNLLSGLMIIFLIVGCDAKKLPKSEVSIIENDGYDQISIEDKLTI